MPGGLSANRSHMDERRLVVHIIENAKVADAKLPNGRHVLERGHQMLQALAAPCNTGRLMAQLLVDLGNDPPLIKCPQR